MFASVGRNVFKRGRPFPIAIPLERSMPELRPWSLVCLFAFLIAFLASANRSPASALEPAWSVHQLKLTEWGLDQGAPPDVFQIAQSPDGFLWLATSTGLYRFDGVTFEKIPPRPGDRTRSQEIVSVLAAHDGSIWMGHRWGGLSVYRNGALRDANHGPPTGAAWRIIEAPDGAIVVATGGIKGIQITRYKAGRWRDIGVTAGLHAGILDDIAFGADGTLWVQADKSIAMLKPNALRYVVSVTKTEGHALMKDPNGLVWAVDRKSIRMLPGDPSASFPLHHGVNIDGVSGPCGLIDRDDTLYICRPDHALDLLRLQSMTKGGRKPGGNARVDETLSLPGTEPLTMFEDKEGNIWIGTSEGIDQLRATNIVSTTFSTTSDHGGLQISSVSNGDLYLQDGQNFEKVTPNGPAEIVGQFGSRQDRVQVLCADGRDGIWVISHTLRHWSPRKTTTVSRGPNWADASIANCAVDGADDLWVSVVQKGLFRRHGGAWTHIILDANRPTLWPMYMTTDRQGRVLAYAGLSNLYRLEGDSLQRLGSAEQLGVGFLRTIYPRTSDMLIGGSNGLSRYRNGQYQILSSDQHPWLASLAGIVQTPGGDTWLNGGEGIVHVRTTDLDNAFSNPARPIIHQLFDANDGLQGSVVRLANYEGRLGRDGRIWFQSAGGLTSINPAHLHHNVIPPPVVIKSVIANKRSYPAANGLVLPPSVTSLQIDYTALSLTVPSRNQFRYRLRGVDKDWIDPGARRQAFYTNLSPGHYRFDVIAANNDGVWNTAGASMSFRIRPAFWQTSAFLLVVIFALTALLWALYSLRLQEMGSRIRLRLEDRMAERERIARELHDTLLQGFQGLTMRLQSVAEQIPPSEPARRLLDQALDRADEVLVEGRDRVKNLRAGEGNGELAFLIEAAAYRLRLDGDVTIGMTVKGDCISLHPLVCDELLAIANEALFNAFKHARATQVDISLACERRQTRLRIADNGVGFDPQVLATISRPGRYGLVGMRERARKLKARLHIGNTANGAEIVVIVPRRVAYASLKRRWSPFPRLAGLES